MATADRPLSGSTLPPRLADVPGRPEVVYLRGELPRGPAVAVVGTRRPSRAAERWTRALSAELTKAGVAVLSGGAVGIDGAAHRGALEAGGRTVVVAPAGYEVAYPEQHAALFAAIVAAGGGYLSLVAPDVPAQRHTFFLRNMALVALAHVLVVVEAPVRSGARNAAKAARLLGRPLLVVPHAPWNWRGRGCIDELRLGARPLQTTNDVLDALQSVGQRPIRPRLRRSSGAVASEQARLPGIEAPSEAERVLDAVRAGACHADELCAVTGLGPARVSQILLTLTLAGALSMAASGHVSLRS